MKRMMLAALLAGALFLPASAWAVNIVANGDFETGAFTSWTLSGNTGFRAVTARALHSGAYGAEFGAVGSLSSIDQSLTTVAGQPYVLSFWLSNIGAPSPPGAPNRFQVEWNGSLLYGVDNMALQPYTQYSFNVTATATSTALKFGFRNDPSWFYLDDVSVDGDSGVPEPGAFQLTMIGAAMIFAAGRFRRRRV